MKRAKGRAKSNQSDSGHLELMTILVASAVIMAAGLFATRRIELARSSTEPAKPTSDDEIYTGSILFVPNDGKICRQLFFDNRTGSVSDYGPVDCEYAYYRNGVPLQWSVAQAISESFYHH